MNEPQTVALREAARSWVDAVLRQYPEQVVGVWEEAPTPQWRRTDARTFQETPTWATRPFRFSDHIQELPEYVDLEAAILAQPVVGPQMNTLVGTDFSSTRLEPINFALELLPKPATHAGRV